MNDMKHLEMYIVLTLILFFAFFVPDVCYAATASCHCDDPAHCYSDGCTRKSITPDDRVDEVGMCSGEYKMWHFDTDNADAMKHLCTAPAPCCLDMVRKNDKGACCWPEINACHPSYCDKLTGDKSTCGWWWEWHDNVPGWFQRPNGYGCVKGNGPDSLQPVFGLPPGVPGSKGSNPTAAPTAKPTQYIRPTLIPTDIPTPIPTQYTAPSVSIPSVSQTTNFDIGPLQNASPTNPPIAYPTNPPKQTSSFSLPSLSMPSIDTGPLKITMKNTIIQSEKVLNIPTQAMDLIAQSDKKLEELIQQLIHNLMDKITGN